jgi:hypothetical protein
LEDGEVEAGSEVAGLVSKGRMKEYEEELVEYWNDEFEFGERFVP